MENNKRKIYVIGHKNPDTDSICSAIAYADIKNRTEENPVYEAKRAGQINEETLYVLKRFQMNTPGYMPNVGTRVKDMDVRKVGGVDSKISLKKAWTLMRNENVFTLPILNQNQELEGLITTNDITESYMDVYNNAALSEARTPYRNILETVDGTMIVGNEHAQFTDGKVLIAASSPEVMEQSVEQNDLVILGNRYEAQLCAIEMGASCIIVCMGVPISKTIRRLAEERECFVISSPHDTYTVARLINQSMPVKHFMTSENLVKFSIDDYTDDIKEVMLSKKVERLLPFLDQQKKVLEEEEKKIRHQIEMVDWYKDYFTYMERNEDAPCVMHLKGRYYLQVPCYKRDLLADMEIRLAKEKSEQGIDNAMYLRQYGYKISYDAFCKQKFRPDYYFIYLNEKVKDAPNILKLPEGDYLCFRERILEEAWNPQRIISYFQGKAKPELMLAMEYEDNLDNYAHANYEIQILLEKN